jgi:hypothetical protein
MVTVRLISGLGNQMFQYAVGRAISLRRGASLALDVSAFPDRANRQYSLGVFKIIENVTLGGPMRSRLLRGLCRRVRLPGLPHVVHENGHAFDPSVLEAPDEAYLIGYWQSEKYFKDVEGVIRREFSFKIEPDPQNVEMAGRIKGLNAVAVHVRRGDYVSDPVDNRTMGTCPREYYREAVQWVASRVSNPHFFVFSDEPDWARANLKLEGPATFVSNNTLANGYEDLRLMSFCRHHIIANSTFSWWAAWLSNSDGITVAPKIWFRSGKLDTRDVVPERWVRL